MSEKGGMAPLALKTLLDARTEKESNGEISRVYEWRLGAWGRAEVLIGRLEPPPYLKP
jgi:hypothetical protein